MNTGITRQAPIVEAYALRRAINHLSGRMFRFEFFLKKRLDTVPGVVRTGVKTPARYRHPEITKYFARVS